MTKRFTYSFKSELSLAQVFARLNEAGPWQWVEWYNDNWGDYIWARTSTEYPAPDRAKVKICLDEGVYVLDATFESELPDAAAKVARLQATLLEQALPAIDAREVTPASADLYD